jgi:hypothetical protein
MQPTTRRDADRAYAHRLRVYCSNPSCAKFLDASLQVTDADTRVKYAMCDAKNCRTRTCTSCKKLVDQSVRHHICKASEEDELFKKAALEQGYQECFSCGAVVELTEACNHIM